MSADNPTGWGLGAEVISRIGRRWAADPSAVEKPGWWAISQASPSGLVKTPAYPEASTAVARWAISGGSPVRWRTKTLVSRKAVSAVAPRARGACGATPRPTACPAWPLAPARFPPGEQIRGLGDKRA